MKIQNSANHSRIEGYGLSGMLRASLRPAVLFVLSLGLVAPVLAQTQVIPRPPQVNASSYILIDA
ncbi:MAG TPA: hypothetical protein GX696_10675, partial [Pseudomonadaceae bacterium]|nr:hypothetical protein [Pseudomonadaceae bacterium]